MATPTPIRCRCDGRYDGCEHGNTCADDGPGRWSPYFCDPCDERRVTTVGAQLREIADHLAARKITEVG